MHTRHVEWLKRAGFNNVGRRTVTLPQRQHSVHFERAAREQKAGISRSDVRQHALDHGDVRLLYERTGAAHI
jgi:hypothetical protein